jgi:hypothetical protein
MNQNDRKRMLEAMRSKNFGFIDRASLDEKISEIDTLNQVESVNITDRREQMKAAITAGNPV